MKDKEKCACNAEVKDEKCICNADECACNTEVKNEKCACNEEGNNKKVKEKHKNKLNDAYNMISSLEDSLLRSKAELVNYRKRKDEETLRMLKYANEDLVKEILPALDNFERAIKLDDNDLSDELSKFLSGFKMIYCHLTKTLENYEVKPIDGINKPFDPTYHQAVLTDKQEGVEPGTVIEVLQKGYLLKDKVIRPAMVKVSE